MFGFGSRARSDAVRRSHSMGVSPMSGSGLPNARFCVGDPFPNAIHRVWGPSITRILPVSAGPEWPWTHAIVSRPPCQLALFFPGAEQASSFLNHLPNGSYPSLASSRNWLCLARWTLGHRHFVGSRCGTPSPLGTSGPRVLQLDTCRFKLEPPFPKIGFVFPRPIEGAIHHNSFPAKTLPIQTLGPKLALFRTKRPPRAIPQIPQSAQMCLCLARPGNAALPSGSPVGGQVGGDLKRDNSRLGIPDWRSRPIGFASTTGYRQPPFGFVPTTGPGDAGSNRARK